MLHTVKPVGFYLAATLLLSGTLWGGWRFGRTASDFGDPEALKAAAKKLEETLGERMGPWKVINKPAMEADALQMLHCPAYISRVYVNELTGDSVSVFVLVGPPGPIAVHTPEVCYSSRDFTISESRQPVTVRDRGEMEHSLWQVDMRSNDAAQARLQVLYGWGTGKNWSATSQPRFYYSGQPYLYKVQLSGPPKNELNGSDACIDFLKYFLADVDSHLLPID